MKGLKPSRFIISLNEKSIESIKSALESILGLAIICISFDFFAVSVIFDLSKLSIRGNNFKVLQF